MAARQKLNSAYSVVLQPHRGSGRSDVSELGRVHDRLHALTGRVRFRRCDPPGCKMSAAMKSASRCSVSRPGEKMFRSEN